MRASSRLAGGYLLIQAIIGYEWFGSGLTKIVHGDFPAGLANDLRERGKQAAPWYRHFLDHSVIPHASTFGYLIESVELAVGVTLILGALLWLRADRFSASAVRAVTVVVGVASFAGLILAVNFVLANGVGFRPVAPDSFDEGIGLDALLVGIQAVLLGVTLLVLRRPRPDVGGAP